MEDKIKDLLKDYELELSNFSQEELNVIKTELSLLDNKIVIFDSKIEQIIQNKVISKLTNG